MATIPPEGFENETIWVEVTPPSVPVNPTYAVLAPTMVGIFTVMVVVKVVVPQQQKKKQHSMLY
jgi:hypothetical protein